MNQNTGELWKSLTIMTPIVPYERIRYGRNWDGGYVSVKTNKMTHIDALYTYGVGDEVSFEQYFVIDNNSMAHCYDHTVDDTAVAKTKMKNIIFHKKGMVSGHGTFQDHVVENGDENKNIMFKTDTEGAEWKFFEEEFNEFFIKHVSQIIIEVHFDGKYEIQKMIDMFQKLREYYNPVHVHFNWGAPMVELDGQRLPLAIELTYIRKDMGECEVNKSVVFPIPNLDFANTGGPDLSTLDTYNWIRSKN